MLKRTVLSIFGAQILALTLVACVSSRRVAVGLSPDMEIYYTIYPSIEFDTAAVTEDEADQIKKAGVDGYFSPDNPLRKRLNPFTAYFGEEATAPRTLYARSALWRTWQNKKPTKMVFIADLPHSSNMPQDDDPRLFFLDIKKRFLTPGAVYIEIEPDKIVRVYTKPKDPRSNSSKKSRAGAGEPPGRG